MNLIGGGLTQYLVHQSLRRTQRHPPNGRTHARQARGIHRQTVKAHAQQQQGPGGVARQLTADAHRHLERTRLFRQTRQGAQHRRMAGIVETRHARVVAVHRQQILGEIIGAYGEEVDPGGERFQLVERRGHLDHHADTRPRDVDALFGQFDQRPIDQRQRRIDFLDSRDHRQHDAQVVQPFRGTQHGPQLHHQHLGVIERHPDAPPAQERIGLVDREIGQVLVTADIQRAHGDRQRRKAQQLLAIQTRLLLLAGEAITHHERHFGAVEPDPADPRLERRDGIQRQAGIHHQRQNMTIRGHTWQILLLFQQRTQRLLLLDQP